MLTEINIPSAAPWVYDLGTRDGTMRIVPFIPSKKRFVPLVFIYAQKGSLKRKLVQGNPAVIFGESTFDPRSKFFTHQTLAGTIASTAGVTVSYQRLVPEDAGEAKLMLSLVLEEASIPTYQRDADGRLVIDFATNQPIVEGTVDGHIYSWEVEDATGMSWEQLVEKGNNGVVTGNSLPPSAPVSGQVVSPGEVVVLDEVKYENQTTDAVTLRGVLDASSITGAGLTDLGALPATPAAGDTLAVGEMYLVDQHIVSNNTGVDITAPAVVTLQTVIDAGMSDEGFVPNALEGVTVNPATYVQFDSVLYKNETSIGKTIRELTLTPADLVDAGLTDIGAWTPSIVTKYPYFVTRYNGPGEIGNNTGIRLFPKSDANNYNVTDHRRFEFGAELVERKERHANVTNIETVFGDKTVSFTFEPNAVDLYQRPLSLDNIVDSYGNMEDPKYTISEPQFEKIQVFQDSIDASLALIAVKEKEATLGMDWSDFNSSDTAGVAGADLKYLANPITSTHSTKAKYLTLVASTDPLSVQLGAYNTVFGTGGSDGTMDIRDFENQVAEYIQRYGDIEDEVQNDARYIETDFFDTGFNNDVKLRLPIFTSIRHDLNLTLAVFENDARLKAGGAMSGSYVEGDPQSRADEIAIATLISQTVGLNPESTTFNTPSMRTSIWLGSGKVRGTTFTKRVPLTFWYLAKLCAYVGSGTGIWRTEHAFDVDPGHVVDNMYDLSNDWASKSIRTRLWDLGITFHLTRDETRSYVPVIRSAYVGTNTDTSALTSAINTRICSTTTRSVHNVFRLYAGSLKLTGERLATAINNEVARDLNGVFDDMAVVVPDAQVGTLDELRGFSITVPVKIYFKNQLTVFTFYIDGLRISDLDQ